MTVGLTTWDVALTFGEIVGEQEGKPVIEETTKILITREIAKVLASLLSTHVKLYEERFGEIRLPVDPETQLQTEEEGEGEAQGEPESLPNS